LNVRRRVVREVGTIAGVAVILAVLVLTNSFVQRDSLAKQAVAKRMAFEKEQEQGGKISLLKWPLIQKTTGGYFKGPTFAEDLRKYDKQPVNIMGFQVPVEQFRDMTEFLLLPMPIECYFCQSPPMKDVILVQMAEGEEPVLISGTLELHEGPKTQFFYVLKDAHWNKPAKSAIMHRKNVPIEHQLPHNKGNEPMMEGTGVPEGASADEVLKSITAPATQLPAVPVPPPQTSAQ
jgi:hypothetical protein